MKNSRNKIYAVDAIMSFIAVFGVVMFLPMLPHLQNYFGVSVSQISWIPNLEYLTMIVFAVIVGRIISKTGIKNMILIALALWISGLVLELIALGSVSFYLFTIGRFIESIGEAFVFPTLISMNKAELKEAKEQKVGSSLIEFGSTIGGLIAAIISGKFINYPEPFLIIPITIATITTIFIIIKIKKISGVEDEKQVINVNEEANESMKAYISLLFMIFMIQIIFASTQVYLAYYMESFKAASLAGGIISIQEIAIGLGTLAPIFIFKKMSFKGIRNLIVVAFAFGVVALGMQISIYPSIVAVSEIGFFVGVGFTVLNIYLSKIIKTNFTQKFSLYASIRNSGGFVLSFIWGKLIEDYRNSGESYAEIFKRLYFFEIITITVIFLIIAFLQKKEVSFKKPRDKQKISLGEV